MTALGSSDAGDDTQLVDHWNDRYRTLGPQDASRFEERPTLSLQLIDTLEATVDTSVIDIGGGTSNLVEHLLDRGHQDMAVLDISTVALDTSRQRLANPPEVTWVAADLTTWTPERSWGLWHDRVVLHFLTDPADQATHLDEGGEVLGPGGAFEPRSAFREIRRLTEGGGPDADETGADPFTVASTVRVRCAGGLGTVDRQATVRSRR